MLNKIPEKALEIDLGNNFDMSGHIFYIVYFRKMAKNTLNSGRLF